MTSPQLDLLGLGHLARDIVNAFFSTLDSWVVNGDRLLLRGLWSALGATTQPLVSGSAFGADFKVMAGIGAAVTLPLLAAAVIQAVAQQDVSGLLRTALVRLPFAVVFTAVVIELVRLGLSATDQASAALLAADGNQAHGVIGELAGVFSRTPSGFVEFFVAVIVCGVAFFVWFELIVRAAAVSVAALFLPLALAGLAWPATSHWARRLGETLAGLVLVKLVIAAVLALAVGALSSPLTGLSGTMEGLALLGLAGLAPFAVFRLIPMIEQGAVAHLDGLGRRAAQGSALRAAAGVQSLLPRSAGGSGGEGGGAGGEELAGGSGIGTRHAGGPRPGAGPSAGEPGRAGETGRGGEPGRGGETGRGGEPPRGMPPEGGATVLRRLPQLEEALSPVDELPAGGG